jgi:hypothetical protein
MMESVSDGTSNTVVVSERVCGTNGGDAGGQLTNNHDLTDASRTGLTASNVPYRETIMALPTAIGDNTQNTVVFSMTPILFFVLILL